MAQVIVMSKKYQERPSKIVDIEDPYLAYCFDEVALFLESEATDDKGKFNYKRLKYADSKPEGNRELADFIKRNGGGKSVL